MSITLDGRYENTESFKLALRFDDFVNEEVKDQVNIVPSNVLVTIVDTTCELVALHIEYVDYRNELCAV